jgi:predicted Zn finger-like uncharacterized protein
LVIRCERCSTLYELDDGLLAIGGSQVQCTRCQHVFTAYPPRAAGHTLVGVPSQGDDVAPARPKDDAPHATPPQARNDPRGDPHAVASVPAVRHAQEDPARAEAPTASPTPEPAPAATAAPPPPPARPRAVRSGPPPVYRPSTRTPPTSGRPPLIRRDTVGTFESRLRWSARWRWLAPAIVAGVVALVAALWLTLGRHSAPDAWRGTEAVSLLAQDDAASLEQGISRLDAVLRRAPKNRTAESERALAYVLRAAAVAEEGESLAARLAARSAERERLGREQPAGWEEAVRAAASDVQKLEAEVKTREERVRSLGAASAQALRRQQAEQGDGPEVARGLAAYHALVGERDRARKVVRAARDKAPADPWLDLAEGWADASDPERAARERALVELGSLSVAHPELLRGRYLLARAEASLGRRGEALRTLDALLAANPRHESARRLKDDLASAPPPAPAPAAAVPPAPPDAAAPVVPEAPLAVNPAPHRRKVVTHTVPAPVPSVTVLPPLMEATEPQDRFPPATSRAPDAASDGPAEGPATPGGPASSAAPTPAGTRTRDVPRPKPDSSRDAEPTQATDGG